MTASQTHKALKQVLCCSLGNAPKRVWSQIFSCQNSYNSTKILHWALRPALGSCQPPWDGVTRAWEAHEIQKTLLQHLVDSSTPAAQFVPSISPQLVKEGWIHKFPLLRPAAVDYFQASQETFSRTDSL